ncbi:MAG: hypothetical protein HC801_10585 [Nitrospira sp.]|jgi:hypothetical protein|nr:hypothetical protein [Nitrospira sp.]
MPHVVVEEAGDLQGLYQAFTPMVHRAGSEILKVQEFYLSRSGKDALLESVAIEQGTACTFFVQLKLHEKAITVRLLPATDPEKTPSVKKLMALVAGFIRKVYPGSRYGKTNLQEYLEATVSSE